MKGREDHSKFFFATQIETIQDPVVLGPVIERPEIAKMPEISRERDKAAYLAKHIEVKRVGDSELFQHPLRQPGPEERRECRQCGDEIVLQLA